MSRKDLSGQRFGRLIVVNLDGSDGSGRSVWLCLCDCGTTKSVKAASLMRGETRSCGCLGQETRKANGIKSGGAQSHPFSKSAMLSEYRCWENMIARCHRPGSVGFETYGGRGIAVCDEWKSSFEQFARDMGKRPHGGTIDRIDNDGDYEPKNCRWATRGEQANNRRNNNMMTVNGLTLTIAQWSQRTGIAWHTLYGRIQHGWSAEDAVSVAVGHRRQR